jgi:hypothetical protein
MQTLAMICELRVYQPISGRMRKLLIARFRDHTFPSAPNEKLYANPLLGVACSRRT